MQFATVAHTNGYTVVQFGTTHYIRLFHICFFFLQVANNTRYNSVLKVEL